MPDEPSTIDRLLRPARQVGGRKPLSTTRPGSLLKNAIPIRTFADWEENKPGFLEVDLVAHCGESTEGFYLNTLSAVDVSSGWSECVPVWGKGQVRVHSAVHRMGQRLPFRLLGVDSDNEGVPVIANQPTDHVAILLFHVAAVVLLVGAGSCGGAGLPPPRLPRVPVARRVPPPGPGA